MTREWFAVQVWSGREQLSASHLRARGYEVFLPCYIERRRWSDRAKSIAHPLFDGYLFCHLAEDTAGKIVTAPGVVRIVGDGRGPLAVPEHEIEAIQRIVETRLHAEPWTFVQAGQCVRIEHGPLRGIEGVVVVAKNSRRLVISIQLLRRSVAVEIDGDWISIPPTALIASEMIEKPGA
jgi:transcription antitermination factor NusG